MENPSAAKLSAFIEACKNKGASDDFLANLLIRRGWPADDVFAAMGEYWAGVGGVAIPERRTATESAREAFLYLLAFSTLCCWATALGSAMFVYIDRWFPDSVSVGNPYISERWSVTWQMASLTVAFPVFLLVMLAIVRGNAARPEQLQSGVRKWLTYIALLGTAGTMIGDLISFLNSLLGGEVTARFVLKSLVVMIICGAIFVYYFRSLRARGVESNAKDAPWNAAFAGISTLAVAAVFITGLTVAGTPETLRTYHADEKRVETLRSLAAAIYTRYPSLNNLDGRPAMPENLAQLVKESRLTAAETKDPDTRRPFEYRVISGTRYELCAAFSHPSEPSGRGSGFWRHNVGRTCYSLDAVQPVPY